jgi:hypothetical protein
MGILNAKKYKIFTRLTLVLVLATTLTSSSLTLLIPAHIAYSASSTGSITDTAKNASGAVCGKNSYYELVAPGSGPGQLSVGNNLYPLPPGIKPLIMNANGKYSIVGVQPGTYDLYISCGGKTSEILSSLNLVVVAGKSINTTPTAPILQAPGKFSCDLLTLNPLNWIACPIISGMEILMNKLQISIDSMLAIGVQNCTPAEVTAGSCVVTQDGSPDAIFGLGNAHSVDYHNAWSQVRDLALILLVIVSLVVIISQAAGFEVLDAYTIRKVLPRLLIVAVALSLSWPLMAEFVKLTNNLGYGISYLINYAFKGLQHTNKLLVGGGGLGLDFGAVGGLYLLGPLGVLLLVLTAVLSILVAFVLLTLRQILIVFLIILAPVAIVAYILPNTQKLYKIWWESFSKALLMFPIIAGIIAAGHAFANVAMTPSDGSVPGLIAQATAFVAYFGPYFLIPYTFKFAGSALGGISGVVNKGASGGFRALSGFRGKRVKTRLQNTAHKAQTGNVFRGAIETSRKGRFNKAVQKGTLLGKAGLNPLNMAANLRTGQAKLINTLASEAAEKNNDFRAISRDNILLIASNNGNGSEESARASLMKAGRRGQDLEDNLSLIRAAKKSMGAQEFAMSATIAEAGTKGGFENGAGDMLEKIARVSGGDKTLSSYMLGGAFKAAEGARRLDLYGAGYGDSETAINLISAARPDQAEAVKQTVTQQLADKALDNNGAGAILSATPGAVDKVFVPAINRKIERHRIAVDVARTGGNKEAIEMAERQFKQTLASTAGLIDVAGQVSPETGRLLADKVLNNDLKDLEGVTKKVGSVVEGYRSDLDFQQMRREQSLTNEAEYRRTQLNQTNP